MPMARHRPPWRQPWRWLLAGLLLVFYVQIGFFTGVLWWAGFNPGNTAFMEAGLTRLRQDRPEAELRHQWVEYERISIHLKRAVVAAEDSRFTSHRGFDWEGLEYALEKNLKKGRIVAGGSTISQQLAKNLFLSPSRNPLRKAQEAVITVMIESVWSKRRILEVYLNVIEWGDGVYGAEAAARHYYKTSAARLGPGQAARMAAMIPNPRHYDRNRGSAGLAKRQAIIARRMHLVTVPK